MSHPGATLGSMVAVAWAAIGLLAATVFGAVFWLGSRIDGLGARMDAMNARLDDVVTRLARVEVRLDVHTQQHAG